MSHAETGHKAKILIIDHEAVSSERLKSRVERLEYLVCASVPSGRTAIEAAETHRPDLVLMDMALQGDMDGVEASRIIRERFNIPIVFISALFDQEILDRAKAARPFGYLLKPFQERELQLTIEMALFEAKADAERCADIKACSENEQKYRQIVDQAPDAMFLVDLDGRIREINDKSCESLGYTREQLLRLRLDQFESSFELSELQEKWSKLRPGQTFTLEGTHRKADGKILPIEVHISRISIGDQDFMLGFARDVSERKQADELLRLMRFTMETTPLCIFWITPEGTLINVNEAACRNFGYDRADLIGRHISEFNPDWTRQLRTKNRAERIARGSATFQTSHKSKDGRVFPIEVTSHFLEFEGREYEASFFQDISSRKQAEKTFRLMEYSLETTSIGIFWMNEPGEFLYVNEAACRSLGYSKQELLQMKVADIVPGYSHAVRKRNWAKRKQRGSLTIESVQRAKDGRIFPVKVTSHFLEFEGQDYEFGFVEDITEWKNTEEMLRLMRSSLETASASICWLTPEGRYFYANEAACRSLGYTREELLNLHLSDIYPDFTEEERLTNIERRRKQGSLTFEASHKTKDGRIFPVEVTTHVFEFEGREYELSYSTDISEQKKSEALLRLMQASLETTSSSIFWLSVEGNYLYVNEAACRSLGYNREELLKMHVSDVNPDWTEELRVRNREARRKYGSQTMETKHRRKDGSIFPVEATSHYFEFDGQEYEFAFVQNITQRKQSEELLRLMQYSLETTSAGIFWISPEGVYSYVNEAACNSLGYSQSELVGMHVSDIDADWSPEKRLHNQIRRKEKGSLTIETQLRHKDGHIFPAEVTSHNFTFEGRDYEFAFAQDISKRKQAEGLLRLMQASLETTSAAIFWVTPEGKFSYANHAACQILGFTRAEILGMHVSKIDPDWTPERRKRNRELREKHGSQSFETRFQSKDGRIFPVEVTSHYLEFEGQYYEFAFAQDISKRKQAEVDLKESEQRLRKQEAQYRLLAENSSDLIWKRDRQFRPTYHSPASLRIFGYTPEEMSRLPLSSLFAPNTLLKLDDLFKSMNDLIDRRGHGEMGWRMELEGIRKDGSTVWVEANMRAALDGNGDFMELVGVSRDITDRKQAEEALRKAHVELEERVRARTAELEELNQALLQEVTERKRAEDQLLAYQNRLKAMDSQLAISAESERRRIAANLHDQIGQMLALSQIKIKSLKMAASSPDCRDELEQLLSLMKQMIKTTRSLTFELSPSILFELGLEQALEWLTEHISERDGLKIDFDCKQCRTFSSEINITIFRAIQELLMNVTKHAQASLVCISLWIEHDCQMISIADDGLGFDTSILESREFNYNRFGLFSLRERLGVIDGRLEIFSEPNLGTRALMKIPVFGNQTGDQL